MIKIKKIIHLTNACPFECEMLSDDGKSIYLRYRNGRLRAGYISSGSMMAPEEYFFDKTIGDALDGFPDDDLFKLVLRNIFELPPHFNFESLMSYDLYL